MIIQERLQKGYIPLLECSRLDELVHQTDGKPFVAVLCFPCSDRVNTFREIWRLLIPEGNGIIVYNLYNPSNVGGKLIVEKKIGIESTEGGDFYQLVSDDPLRDMDDNSIVSDDFAMPFGKYKVLQKKISEVMDCNPQYIVWALKNYKWFAVSPSLVEAWLREGRFQKFITPDFVEANNRKAWKIITGSFSNSDRYRY